MSTASGFFIIITNLYISCDEVISATQNFFLTDRKNE